VCCLPATQAYNALLRREALARCCASVAGVRVTSSPCGVWQNVRVMSRACACVCVYYACLSRPRWRYAHATAILLRPSFLDRCEGNRRYDSPSSYSFVDFI